MMASYGERGTENGETKYGPQVARPSKKLYGVAGAAMTRTSDTAPPLSQPGPGPGLLCLSVMRAHASCLTTHTMSGLSVTLASPSLQPRFTLVPQRHRPFNRHLSPAATVTPAPERCKTQATSRRQDVSLMGVNQTSLAADQDVTTPRISSEISYSGSPGPRRQYAPPPFYRHRSYSCRRLLAQNNSQI
jgi:hypothetical protein